MSKDEELNTFVARNLWRAEAGFDVLTSFEDLDAATQNHYKFLASRARTAIATFELYKTMLAAQGEGSVIIEDGSICPQDNCSKLKAHLPPHS